MLEKGLLGRKCDMKKGIDCERGGAKAGLVETENPSED